MPVTYSVFYLGHNSQLNAFLEPLTKQTVTLTGYRFKAGERKGENGLMVEIKTPVNFSYGFLHVKFIS